MNGYNEMYTEEEFQNDEDWTWIDVDDADYEESEDEEIC